MTPEKPGKLGIFSPTLWPPCMMLSFRMVTLFLVVISRNWLNADLYGIELYAKGLDACYHAAYVSQVRN